MSGRDPKGYYVALGVEVECDIAAIKSAFRTKAKRLHPDFNPSPIAAKQFNRLHEAYATLIDPKKRAAYDRPWKDAPRSQEKPRERAAEAPPRPEPRPGAQPEQRAAEPPPRATPRPAEPPPKRAAADAPVLCQCGQLTAQPRYVLFDMVWGRVKRVQRRTLGGVYCRACADKAAIRASLVSWVAGWWAWPDGPRETIRAVLNNIRGGRRPADRNARLLLRQARAFAARGDMELARNAALQARAYASATDVRGDVERMIATIGLPTGRVLKDRWSQPGWAPTIQILPLALVGAIIAMSATIAIRTPGPSTPVAVKPAPAVVETLELKPAPTAFNVVSEVAVLRTGPSDVFEVVTTLAKGDQVIALETDPTGAWMRVSLEDGRMGFVASANLSLGK